MSLPGLRGDAVQALLDPAFVLRISDVTSSFRQAGALLAAGDESGARAALWPETPEAPMVVPGDLRAVLKMDEEAPAPSPAPAAAPRTGATAPPETVIPDAAKAAQRDAIAATAHRLVTQSIAKALAAAASGAVA